MRTTLSIDTDLLERAKKRATHRGQTLGQYVESAVRRDLAEPTLDIRELPVFTGGVGMRRGIDPTSNRALYDALDSASRRSGRGPTPLNQRAQRAMRCFVSDAGV